MGPDLRMTFQLAQVDVGIDLEPGMEEEQGVHGLAVARLQRAEGLEEAVRASQVTDCTESGPNDHFHRCEPGHW